MKKKKRYGMMLVAALLCAAVLAGCGAPSDADGPGTDGPGGDSSGAGSSGGLVSEPEKEPQIVADFDYDDLMGNWYGIADGKIYAMSVVEYQKRDDEPLHQWALLATSILGGEHCGAGLNQMIQIIPQELTVKFPYNTPEPALSGIVMAEERSDDEGNPIEYCLFLFRPDGKVLLCRADLYDDGSLHAVTLTENRESEELLYYASDFAVFTRKFPFPSQEVDRERGILSGIWHVCHEEEDFFLIAYPDGTFCMCLEEIPVTGTYEIEGDTVSLTCRVADGESYTGDDAVRSVTLGDDNSIALGEVVMPPLEGKLSGSWTSVPAEGQPVYHLELTENGGYVLRVSESGSYGEEVGICLYRSDTEMDLMCLTDGQSSVFGVRNTVTVDPDGSLTLKEGTQEICFEKD